MKRGIHKYGLLAFLWLAYTLPSFAQPNDPDASDDPPATPIDNWIIMLLFIAATLGIYFVIKYKNKQLA